jgi:CcmD family protein
MRPDDPMRLRTLSRLAAIAAAALTLSLSPAPRLAAQDSVATAPAATAAVPEQTLRRDVLPADDQPPPPRTLRAYWHVFIALGLAWLLVFGYTLSLGRRFRALEREVDTLRGAS